jgi:surface protein
MNHINWITIIAITCLSLSCTATPKHSASEETTNLSNNVTSEEPQTDTSETRPVPTEPNSGIPETIDTAKCSEPCVVPFTHNPIPKEEQRPFILTYETLKPNRSVGIEYYATISDSNKEPYPYDFDVDCEMNGEYKNYKYTDSLFRSADIVCNYEKKGLHQIAIRGDVPYLKLDVHGELDPRSYDFILRSIDQWGDIRWKRMSFLLAIERGGKFNPHTKDTNYPELKAKDIPDLRDVCDIGLMFAGNEPFDTDISAWDVSHVEDMYGLFMGCKSFNQDISQWNVSNVKRMELSFSETSSFNQNISKWDVSNVTNMRRMFEKATSFNQDISKWDVSNVQYMSGMFDGATSFNQNISQWDISSLLMVDDMFRSNDKDKVICEKCEGFRQKVLQKNASLPSNAQKLWFDEP